jgi:hypothetical protein
VAFVRTDVSEELSSSLASSETSVIIRTTRHNIPEDTILHSHRRENLGVPFNAMSSLVRRIGTGLASKAPLLHGVSSLNLQRTPKGEQLVYVKPNLKMS